MAEFRYVKSPRELVRPHKPRNSVRAIDPSGNLVHCDVRRPIKDSFVVVEEWSDEEIAAEQARRRS